MAPLLRLLSTFLIVFVPFSAFAALGGTPETFESANTAVKKSNSGKAAVANIQARTEAANYSVRETALQTGTVVREYVSEDGIVFAVSWKGPFQPNLRKLLGSRYFKTMTDHAKRTPGGGKSGLAVEDSEVIIQTRGHMRSHEGKAWLPSQMPSGFSETDIQ